MHGTWCSVCGEGGGLTWQVLSQGTRKGKEGPGRGRAGEVDLPSCGEEQHQEGEIWEEIQERNREQKC